MRETTDRAIADRDVLAVERVDSLGAGSGPGGQPAELEAVHVDGDVVGLDVDHVAGRGTIRQVLLEAVDALRRDDHRD